MGLSATLPLLLGGGATLAGLFNQWRSQRVRTNAVQPGALPGTGAPVEGLIPEGLADMVNTGSQYSNTIGALPAQWQANEESRDVQRGYLDDVVGIMEGSRLNPLADRVGEWSTSFDDYASGVEGAEGADPFSQRMKSHQEKQTDLTDRIKTLNEEVSGNFRETIADPTVMTDDQMGAIVGRYMAGNRQAAVARNRANEADAAARGLSPAAVAALREQTAGNQRLANLSQIAEVAGINAGNEAQLRERANESLGTIGGDLLTREGNIDAMFESMDDDLVSQVLPGLISLEGDLGERYENRLGNAVLDRAAIEQPEDYAVLGQIFDQVNAYNVLLEAGAYSEAAALLSQTGGAFLELGNSAMDREAMSDYAESQQGSWYDSLLSAVPKAGGAVLGAVV